MVRKSINLQIVQGKIQRSFSLVPSSWITNGQLFINNESNLHSVQRVGYSTAADNHSGFLSARQKSFLFKQISSIQFKQL